MISLSFTKQIKKLILKVIDETIGKKFPIIDKATDLLQEQDNKIRDIELRLDALEYFLKKEDKNE